MAFLIRWLERWQEMGWRRRRVTCSEGPQVGLEPSAAAATTKPRCMGCELYWTNAVPGRSRLQTSDYASSPHLEQNLYCPHRGIASPPLAKLNSHCGNRCCLQAQCNPCTSQYDQIISLWEADDTEIDSSHNKTRFQWASIISEPVRNDLNMRGILLPTEKKKKKVPEPWVWPKLWAQCDACVQGGFEIPPCVVLCRLSWKAHQVERTLWRLRAKPLADDPAVKLISYSHKTFQMQQNIWAAVRPGKEITSPRVVYNGCVPSWTRL